MKKIKPIHVFFIWPLFLILLLSAPSLANEKLGSEEDQLKISLEVKNKPLSDVLQSISENTGYIIKVNKELLDIQVSGSFKNTTLTALMSRILKDHNVFIIDDSTEKLLSVRSSVMSRSNEDIAVFTQDDESKDDLVWKTQHGQELLDKYILVNQDGIEAYPGVSYRNFIESRDELNIFIDDNPSLVMASSGRTYANLKESQVQLDQHIDDIDVVRVSVDHSYHEMLAVQKQLDSHISTDNTVEASPGVSYQDLMKQQAQLDNQLRARK